jgi:hypothetical protein
MAREEISETGEPEKVKAQDRVSTVPEGPVIICDLCGKGFLTMITGGVDIDPIWVMLGARENGGICGGALTLVSRSRAIQIADDYEQIGGDEWLRGRRKP